MADNPGTIVILVIITLLRESSFSLSLYIFQLTLDASVPPLGVFFVSGCSVDFIINILLTILA